MHNICNKTKALTIFLPLIMAIVLVFNWGINYFYKPPADALLLDNKTELVTPDGKSQIIDSIWFSNCIKDKNFQEGLYSYNYTFTISETDIDKSADYLLILPYIDSPAIRIYLNGQYIGNQGDMLAGQSNIWNSPKIFYIPDHLLQTSNNLQVILRGDIYVGVKRPPYILKKENHRTFLFFLSFISDTAIWLLSGSLLIMGLSTLLIGITTVPKIDARLILGLAGLCSSFFMINLATIEFLPYSALEFKRIGVILRHTGSMLFVIGIIRLLERPLDKFAKVFISSQIIALILLIFPRDLRTLKLLYSYTYFTIIPLPVYLLILLMVSRNFKAKHLVLFSGVSIGLASAIHDIFIPFIFNYDLYVSQYGFMVLGLSTSGFVVVDFMNNYSQLYREKNRAENYRHASLRDPLTEAFNRNIIPHLIDSINGVFSIIAVDLNDFKNINDSYGHLTGDAVLKDLVYRMNCTFRREDYIIRYGGDEFIVILPLCPLKITEQLIAKLNDELSRVKIKVDKHEVNTNVADMEDEYIPYTISSGSSFYNREKLTLDDFDNTIKIADANMYENKRKLKQNKIAMNNISLN